MSAQTREEFLQARRLRIGGSDISAILGISPWKTPVALWDEKTRERTESLEDRDNRMVKTRGKRWESVVAEMLVEELEANGHKVEIVTANCRYTDSLYDVFACEIDFEIRLDGEDEITNCELKTVHPFKTREWGESGSDQLPVHYTAQGMWGLGVTRRRRCIMAPLFGADEIRTFPIYRDESTIAGMRERAQRFWEDHVLTRIAPPAIELEDAERLYRKETEGSVIEANDELTGKILRLRATDKLIKAQQAEADALEFELKLSMADAAEIVVDGKSAITWKERPHSYLDQEALRREQPALSRKYTRKGSSRVFTLKSFGWK